jgi:hypothetical protein
MDKYRLGKLQIIIGILFFCLTITLFFFGFRYIINGFVDSTLQMTSEWGKVSENLNGTNIGIVGQLVSHSSTQALSLKETAVILLVGFLNLLLMSIFILTEGINKCLDYKKTKKSKNKSK